MSALVFFIPLIVIGSLILVGFAASANQHTDCRYTQMSIDFHNQSLTISHGDYNISFSINALQSTITDKIRINPNVDENQSTNNEISGLTVYINSTAVNMRTSLNYHLNNGDHIQVNAIMPCTQAHSNEASITIFSPQCKFYQETTLP